MQPPRARAEGLRWNWREQLAHTDTELALAPAAPLPPTRFLNSRGRKEMLLSRENKRKTAGSISMWDLDTRESEGCVLRGTMTCFHLGFCIPFPRVSALGLHTKWNALQVCCTKTLWLAFHSFTPWISCCPLQSVNASLISTWRILWPCFCESSDNENKNDYHTDTCVTQTTLKKNAPSTVLC